MLIESCRSPPAKACFHLVSITFLYMAYTNSIFNLQFANENPDSVVLPQVIVKDAEDISEDKVTVTLKRAMNFYSTLQSHDGHWPGDYGGPMFLMPGLVSPNSASCLPDIARNIISFIQ